MGVGRNILNWYARLAPARGKVSPPYGHVIQIGDPRLRKVCEAVPVDSIKTDEIQTLLQKLKYVMSNYGSLGMSAPQIGVNKTIFVMNHTAKQIAAASPESRIRQGFTEVPFTVFINPKMKVINYQKIIHTEGCESVRSFAADVARYKEVEITGYNSEAELTSQVYKDWAARIVQHELDHLEGKIFTDIMDRKTLSCTCWEEVNLSRGKVAIPFSPE